MQAYKEGTLSSIPVARRKVVKISPKKKWYVLVIGDLLFKETKSAICRPDQSIKGGMLSPGTKM